MSKRIFSLTETDGGQKFGKIRRRYHLILENVDDSLLFVPYSESVGVVLTILWDSLKRARFRHPTQLPNPGNSRTMIASYSLFHVSLLSSFPPWSILVVRTWPRHPILCSFMVKNSCLSTPALSRTGEFFIFWVHDIFIIIRITHISKASILLMECVFSVHVSPT